MPGLVRLRDIMVGVHCHNGHGTSGPIIRASPNVYGNRRNWTRLYDLGRGSDHLYNIIARVSRSVYANRIKTAILGSITANHGCTGRMVTASPNVFVIL